MKLNHFTRGEFRTYNRFTKKWTNWFDQMNEETCIRQDALRSALGYRIDISKVDGALGRHLGKFARSRHNIDRWGSIEAIDSHPLIVEPRIWYEAARDVGIRGFGVYFDWNRYGIHIDTGTKRSWGRIPANNKNGYLYVSDIEEAFAFYEKNLILSKT